MNFPLRKLRAAIPAIALSAACGAATLAQAPPATSGPTPPPEDPTTVPAVIGLRPALAQVSAAVANLRIDRWKGGSGLRDATEQDAGSIRRDLTTTLPPLLDQAQAGGAPLAPSFAVFRNIDALYDVVLRVAEMATLAGSPAEAGSLEDARAALELSRAQLANALLHSIANQDTQLAHFRALASEAKAAPKPVPKKIVVDDGPEPAKRHRKPTKPAAPQ